MANKRKISISAGELEELYVANGLSQQTISEMLNISQVTVSHELVRAGIKSRGFHGKRTIFMEEGDLRRFYHEMNWTMDQIADHYGCSSSAVRHNLIRFGLDLPVEEILSRRIEHNKTAYSQQFVHGSGHRHIRSVHHPDADKNGYVPEHRLVVESAIGRPLSRDERVHHISMVKLDNRIENLALMPDVGTHMATHRYMERIAVYLLGLTETRPEPLGFSREVFWGGQYVTQVDLLSGTRFAASLEQDFQPAALDKPAAIN